MMMKRCLTYLGMALAVCLGSFTANAADRVVYLTALTFGDGGSYSAQSVRHELTLRQWRTESQPINASVASNLIALSNHFGLTRAAPFGVPDWDSGSAA